MTHQPTGIEALVCEEIAKRQQLGLDKYGTSVADNPLSLKEWLQHGLEESLDLAVYLRRAIADLERKKEAQQYTKEQWWVKELEGFWGDSSYEVTLDTRRAAKVGLDALFEQTAKKMLPLSDEVAAFKRWYDAIWLGDGEHGQYIPTIKDAKFYEYMDGYTLAFGAWMSAKAHSIKGNT